MSILPHYIISSARQKTELRIRKSKCFFLLQLYSLTPTEIDTFRQKIAPLGLRLIRFPVINWKKTSIAFLRTANHLPVQISNYALLGDNPLNPEALSTLNTILHEDQVVLLFGSQENVWFNSQRLGESPEWKTHSSQKVVETIHSSFQTFSNVAPLPQLLHQLLQSLEFLTHQLK